MSHNKHIQTEVDAAYLYGRLALHEDDETMRNVFHEMSDIEKGHAVAFLKKNGLQESKLPGPSIRARILNFIGKTFGYEYVLGVLMDMERRLTASTMFTKRKFQVPVTGHEANHVRILRAVLERQDTVSGQHLGKVERRHRSVGGNALRAAVLGGNDGLISNFGLVMGVAGATDGESVLVAGLAGMLAGALSMAMGEWISVKSSQELSENQMQLELDELETNPEGERRELELIYRAKGMTPEQSKTLADDLMKDKDRAYEVLVREELGIQPEELKGSAVEAAVYSFILFALGAIIPVAPFFFMEGFPAIITSVLVSALGLFGIGAAITLFTGRSVFYSGMRQVLFGVMAAAVTFGIGRWIGIQLL